MPAIRGLDVEAASFALSEFFPGDAPAQARELFRLQET
jgi:hypothetical protein